MARITVGDQEFTYDRLAKNRSETIFEAALVVESRTGEVSVRRIEMDASARGDLTTDAIQDALGDWQTNNQNLTIQRFVVRETNSCGAGKRVGTVAGDETTGKAAGSATSSSGGDETAFYRGGSPNQTQVGFGDIPVDEGEEVEFHVAGPSTSVYGTDTGSVTGVKTGTDGYHVLLIETDSGTKRVREEWIVDEDESDDAS